MQEQDSNRFLFNSFNLFLSTHQQENILLWQGQTISISHFFAAFPQIKTQIGIDIDGTEQYFFCESKKNIRLYKFSVWKNNIFSVWVNRRNLHKIIDSRTFHIYTQYKYKIKNLSSSISWSYLKSLFKHYFYYRKDKEKLKPLMTKRSPIRTI